MLAITPKRKINLTRTLLGITAGVLVCGGLYVLSLVAAPSVAPLLTLKPIDVKALPSPNTTGNRIIIPKIGVNIAYGKGQAALDSGAEWRSPDSGNPVDGGNFILAAHRFSLQPTVAGTIKKSPFYNLKMLEAGDTVFVDYKGKRYGYKVDKTFSVSPSEMEIEAQTSSPTLTLYSFDSDGGERFVVQASRLGEIATN